MWPRLANSLAIQEDLKMGKQKKENSGKEFACNMAAACTHHT